MAFRPPVFNITVKLWRHGSDTSGAADGVPEANFCGGRRMFGGNFKSRSEPADWSPTAYLLLPKDTVIVGDTDTVGAHGDTVEIPSGSGKMYHCLHQERTALGFLNEHVTAVVVKIPPDSDVDTGTDDGVLMEDDGFVLMEGGDHILEE